VRSGDGGQRVVGQEDLAVDRPVIVIGRSLAGRTRVPEFQVTQDALDDDGLLAHREEAYLPATVGTDQGIGLVDLFDEPCPSSYSIRSPIDKLSVAFLGGETVLSRPPARTSVSLRSPGCVRSRDKRPASPSRSSEPGARPGRVHAGATSPATWRRT